ncbi:MAG: starvation-sensing protein RspA [Candidatus Omnitrophica bacterium]|nr:starvation-sensing protein RspA [Candidatus Omnitrophota bacterium]
MKRRDMLSILTAGGAGMAGASSGAKPVWAAKESDAIKITDVKVVLTAPERIRLVVVKVETSEPGLYGWGCATFTQRPLTVKTAVEEYLRPFLIGKNPDNIEDIWQSCFVSSYWRNGPVLNNAISGVDMALWDIKGKRAGMPVYQLLGGKCRFAADLYAHASGRDFQELEDRIRRWMERGYRHVRAQASVPGYSAYGAGSAQKEADKRLPEGTSVFEPSAYVQLVPQMFEYLRDKLGYEVKLLHDTHERISNSQAVSLVKRLEPYDLFFLEDPLPPEQVDHFRRIREQCSTPLAMGELFNNAHEWIDLVSERLIDYMRVHLSQIGGLTPARKLAAFCEIFGVKTAWHGPGDLSPFGQAANIALDLACYNFGVQEQHIFNDAANEVFPGCLKIENGYMFANEAPGWGIECNEELAKKYPFTDKASFDMFWGNVRRPDGTIVRP